MRDKFDIRNLKFEELQEKCKELGYPVYRAKQIFQWLHVKRIDDFNEMSNLSLQIREKLNGFFYIKRLNISKRLVSSIDNTVKYLYGLNDKNAIETVFMKYDYGNSVCISTQVGCKMGCTFCASTKAGYVRNLHASEMLDQIYVTETDMQEKASTIVLMGIGEPLDNFENVLRFLNIIKDPNGRNISLRHITISTCGLVDKIYELANLNLGVNLSVSLHAPNDLLRKKTMPIAKKWSVKEITDACTYFSKQTGRRVSYEYALIKNFNDFDKHINELANLLKGKLCHVNLIPINTIQENMFQSTDKKNIYKFQQKLVEKGINATVRRTLGTDISAACGQLRSESLSSAKRT